MTEAEVYRAAAEVLREREWGQGGVATRLIAAISIATDDRWTFECAALYSIIGWPVAWNDTPGRTVVEVLDVLERAAVLAETNRSPL